MNNTSKRNPPSLSKRVTDLKKRIAALEEFSEKFGHLLKSDNNWTAVTERWKGKKVELRDSIGRLYMGPFLWSDRYTIAMFTNESEMIFNKGAVVSIRLIGED